MENSEIRDKIFKGLRDVFDFYESANLEIEHYIKPEYLLTVKIADRLCQENNGFKIKLEEPTSDFANSCVQYYNNGFSILDHNSTRDGKIDIAVYSTEAKTGHKPYKPLFPIEIKNVNPYKYGVILDIKRNLELFAIENKVGGKSVIEKAYNVSIEEFKDVYTECLEDEIDKRKKKYERWLKESNLFTNEYEFEVFIKTLDFNPISKTSTFSKEEGGTEITGNYCRLGIIIELRKK